MKDLIVPALNEAYNILLKRIPKTKPVLNEMSISDVKPTELLQFMKDNDIPEDADFGGIDNGYGGYSDICLHWYTETKTSEKENINYCKKYFTDIAWHLVYNVLITNGYARKGYNTALLNQFGDTTVYDMYINKEFDRLETYYSLPFVKI
jgi:hypothetical protein